MGVAHHTLFNLNLGTVDFQAETAAHGLFTSSFAKTFAHSPQTAVKIRAMRSESVRNTVTTNARKRLAGSTVAG
jgi:hypothetical protein